MIKRKERMTFITEPITYFINYNVLRASGYFPMAYLVAVVGNKVFIKII